MGKTLIIGAFAYMIGAFGVSIVRAMQLWESLGVTSLMREAAYDGLLWPFKLMEWIA